MDIELLQWRRCTQLIDSWNTNHENNSDPVVMTPLQRDSPIILSPAQTHCLRKVVCIFLALTFFWPLIYLFWWRSDLHAATLKVWDEESSKAFFFPQTWFTYQCRAWINMYPMRPCKSFSELVETKMSWCSYQLNAFNSLNVHRFGTVAQASFVRQPCVTYHCTAQTEPFP